MIDNDSKVFVSDGKNYSLNEILEIAKKQCHEYGTNGGLFCCEIEYCGGAKLKSLCSIDVELSGGFKIHVCGTSFSLEFKSVSSAIEHLNNFELNKAKLIIERQNEILKALDLIGYVGE